MRAWVISIACAISLGGCSLIVSLDGLSGGAASSDAGGGDASADQFSSLTNGAADASAASDASDAAPNPCGGTAGPTFVSIGNAEAGSAFCIDSTEVTNAQYQLFFAAKGGDMSGQPSECAWNTTYLPGEAAWPAPSTLDAFPVRSVDWCDAYAYCAWAGKRLCGQIGGGPVDPINSQNFIYSQWMYACTPDGGNLFPYPGSYDASTCDTSPASYEAVMSRPTCQGGFPGIFDMSGSVEEWEDSCDDSGTPANDACRRRGGSFADGIVVDGGSPGNYECGSSLSAERSQPNDDVGFRCCSK